MKNGELVQCSTNENLGFKESYYFFNPFFNFYMHLEKKMYTIGRAWVVLDQFTHPDFVYFKNKFPENLEVNM